MKGPIAIFDILGYQNFLEKNPDLKSVESVLDLISETPNEIIKAIPLTSSRFSEIVQKGFRYLVFSDTIVCGFEFEKIDSKQHDDAWAYLIFHTQTLYRLLFSKGFPLRGVLHYGDFLLKGSCVAGIAMVESYKQMIEIDFAGVVVTEQAISQVKILLDKSPPLKMLMTECLPSYLFPMKSGKEQIFNIVDCMPDELREQSAN